MAAHWKSSLTDRQLELLLKHLEFYQSLDDGTYQCPSDQCPSDAQRQFVKVVGGHMTPVTEHEIAYLAYKRDRKNAGLELENLRIFGQRLKLPEEDKPNSQEHKKAIQKANNKANPTTGNKKANNKANPTTGNKKVKEKFKTQADWWQWNFRQQCFGQFDQITYTQKRK